MGFEVSVIIPVWNTPIQFLDLAVRSIEAQTFDIDKIEVCIHDDGSDEYYKLQYFNWLQGSSRTVEVKSGRGKITQGAAYARNNAISTGQGKYIILLDSDDFLHPDAVKKCVKVLERNKHVQLVYSDNIEYEWPTFNILQYRKKNLYHRYHEKYKGSIFDSALQSTFIPGIQAFRRQTFLSLNGFNTELLAGEDIDFITRIYLLDTKCNFFHIPETLYFRLHNPRSLSRRMQDIMRINTEDIFTNASWKLGLNVREVKYYNRIEPYFISHYFMINKDGCAIIPPYLDIKQKRLIESRDVIESLKSEATNIIKSTHSCIIQYGGS